MAKLQEKAQAQVKQMVGQIIGDDQLMEEGKEQQQKADQGEEQPKANEGAQTVERKLPIGPASQERCRDPATGRARTPGITMFCC